MPVAGTAMNAGEAVGDALDVLAAERTSFLSLGDTVRELGGTRAAAAAFGVTQRTVQRWIKQTPGQQRRLARSAPTIRGVVAAVQRGLAAERLRADMSGGFGVSMGPFALDVNGQAKYRRTREREDEEIEDPDEEELAALIDAWLANDQDGMATAFSALYVEAWGHGTLTGSEISDIDGLALVVGG